MHNHRRCPLVLFGHANGQLKGGVHLKAADGTPMANVMLTLLHQLGHRRPQDVRRQHGRVLARVIAQTAMPTIAAGLTPGVALMPESSHEIARAVSACRRRAVPDRVGSQPRRRRRRSPTPPCAATATPCARCSSRAPTSARAQGDGMTALHWAAERGDAAMAEMLLYAGANVVGRAPASATTRRSTSPAAAGSAAVVQALLKAGADVGAHVAPSGVTPLHLAADAGSADVVNALLDAGADVNAKEAEWGQTPLIFAAAAEPRRRDQGAPRARRRPERRDEDHRRRRSSAALDRAAARASAEGARGVGAARAQTADAEPGAGRDRSVARAAARRARFRRPMRRSRARARRRGRGAAAGGGATPRRRNFNPEEINPPVVDARAA